MSEAQIGSQWSTPIDITQPSSTEWGIFGALLCDPYQNVHVLWADNSQSGAAVFYRNDVNGDWSPPTDVLVVSEPVIIGLNAAIDPKTDILHVVWKNQWTTGALYYSQVPLISADDPRAWSAPHVMVDAGVTEAKVQADPVGAVHLIYGLSNSEGTQNTVFHIMSDDGGESWSDPVAVVLMTSELPSVTRINIAIDAVGRIHVGVTLRSQEYGLYSEVGYVRSVDGGQTWSEYEQIETMGITFQGVEKIAPYAFGEDEIHLTWHDPRRMHQWSADGGETWSYPTEIMPLGAAFGGENQLAKDSGGTVHVVTAVGDGVFSAQWDGRSWQPPEQIDDRPIDPHGQGIIACQGNQLHVVYYDRTGPETVWYSTRQVDAPHIPRRPLPVPVAQPTALATEQNLPEPTATGSSSVPSSYGVASEPGSDLQKPASSPILPLLISGAAALVLIVGVVVSRRQGRS